MRSLHTSARRNSVAYPRTAYIRVPAGRKAAPPERTTRHLARPRVPGLFSGDLVYNYRVEFGPTNMIEFRPPAPVRRALAALLMLGLVAPAPALGEAQKLDWETGEGKSYA